MESRGSRPPRRRRRSVTAHRARRLDPLLPATLAASLVIACGSGSAASVRGGAVDAGGGQAVRGPPASGSVALPPSGMAWVIFGTDTVHAEVASTEAQRERGLMGREAVPDGTGMLFVFPRSEERLFWMKDTRVPLDVAVFDARNQVTAIKQLQPLDESLVGSGAPTALVLEVPRGWLAERGIGVGAVADVVFGPGDLLHVLPQAVLQIFPSGNKLRTACGHDTWHGGPAANQRASSGSGSSAFGQRLISVSSKAATSASISPWVL